jgi:hypothetical protein
MRWNVRGTGEGKRLGDELTVWLHRADPDAQSTSPLAIAVRFGGRIQSRPLPREHIETRGRSQWFNDSTWRLSEAGLTFWAENLHKVLRDRAATAEVAS